MQCLKKVVLILAALHQLEGRSTEGHPKEGQVKVKHFVTPDGDIGYTKMSSTGGVNGYHKFEKFKKKDGDRYGHGIREGMGEEKQEYYSSQDKKSPTVQKMSHSYQVMEENDQKVQKPPKGGYQGYAPIKEKFGKHQKEDLVMPVPDSAEYEFHVLHYAKPPFSTKHHSSGYHSKPTPKPTPAIRHTSVPAKATDQDYDDEIDENGRYMKESSDEDYENGSDEKNADIMFKNEYKTIADHDGDTESDSADNDYFSKQFDKYYNDDYKFMPFGESGERHTSGKQSKQTSEEEDDEDESSDDDDGSESSHFTYASEADGDASSS